MSEPNNNWKKDFRPGEKIPLKGLEFVVVAIGKRSLILHPPKPPKAAPKKIISKEEAWALQPK